MERATEHVEQVPFIRRGPPAAGRRSSSPRYVATEVPAQTSLAAALLRPVLTAAALPVVFAASAAYWLVAAGIIERRLAPSTVRAERG